MQVISWGAQNHPVTREIKSDALFATHATFCFERNWRNEVDVHEGGSVKNIMQSTRLQQPREGDPGKEQQNTNYKAAIA